jgi:aryl-alcohol dehydrogenase-like predicted oxidoreductase
MQYRPFGRTDWSVSEIAFGAWQLGGDWGPVHDEASIDTLLYAFESGINFVDTAKLYGDGHSERVVGEALRRWHASEGESQSGGHKIYVATKAAPLEWPHPTDENPLMRGRYPEWYLRASVEGSLQRLGVERIDLFQLHSWMTNGVHELDWLETLNQLRLEGKIDQIGVSIRDYRAADGVGLAQLGLVSSQQVIFNMFEQTPAQELFAAGRATDTAFIARVPLDSGSLVGHWTEATYDNWMPGSVPHKMFQGDRFATTLARIDALKKVCAPYFPTLAEAAMRFALSEQAVSSVIPGMMSREEVDMNTKYSDKTVFPAELTELVRAHTWVRNYYWETRD